LKSIWIDLDRINLRSYGATTKGARSLIRLELETTDPRALARLLEEIGEVRGQIERERRAAADEARAAKRRDGKKLRIGRQTMLAIPYFEDDAS